MRGLQGFVAAIVAGSAFALVIFDGIHKASPRFSIWDGAIAGFATYMAWKIGREDKP